MKEKKIIVTGSSRGLGLHIANKLLQEQHKVIFNGRSKKKKLITLVEIFLIQWALKK